MDDPKSAPAKTHHNNRISEWYLIDARNKILGRLATDIAKKLLGKHSVTSAENTVAPVKIVVVNTDFVALTGKKEENKVYFRYSGYPGGLRKRTVAQQRQKDSRQIIASAVLGMLPKNKLRTLRMKNLLLYKDDKHPHAAQIQTPDLTSNELK